MNLRLSLIMPGVVLAEFRCLPGADGTPLHGNNGYSGHHLTLFVNCLDGIPGKSIR